jgi:hypothetical protein
LTVASVYGGLSMPVVVYLAGHAAKGVGVPEVLVVLNGTAVVIVRRDRSGSVIGNFMSVVVVVISE